MSYSEDSSWNEKNEIKCLIIYKKLEAKGFPRGMQMDLCRKITKETNLDPGNLSAKISNYKSVAGVNKHSNASSNTIELYNKYKNLSIQELENLT